MLLEIKLLVQLSLFAICGTKHCSMSKLQKLLVIFFPETSLKLESRIEDGRFPNPTIRNHKNLTGYVALFETPAHRYFIRFYQPAPFIGSPQVNAYEQLLEIMDDEVAAVRTHNAELNQLLYSTCFVVGH
jgi:hypothetical protein